MKTIFKNLKVIELAGVLAGPGVGYFFAELGASVIKVENPLTGGDVTRSWKLKSEDPKDATSAYYWSVNAFKEILNLDITNAKQLQKLYDLIKEADVVITNYKFGDDVKLKVDYTTLTAINPRLIYASVTGFGAHSARTAYDLILQAESGFMSMNGEPGSQPVKMPVALIDVLAGHQLKEAILIALLRRAETGKGAHVSVSLFNSAIASLVNQATNWLIAKHLPKPLGSTHPNIAPYGELFETKDKHLITFAIGSNKQFKQLCTVLDYPSLASDSKYANNQLRVNNRAQLYTLLYDYVKRFNFEEVFKRCMQHEVPVGKVRNLKEVFEMEEARKMLLEVKHGDKKFNVVSGISFEFMNES